MPSLSGTPRDNAAVSSAFRVLIVDDQQSVRDAIARLLATRGYDAVTAESGAAALARLQAEYFDVMLCDVRMPKMSGLELLSAALLLDRDLPVLMLSGLNDIATARDALARGAMDYLKKPIELDDLDDAVRAAAHHRRNIARRTPAGGTAVVGADGVELKGGPRSGQWVPWEESRYRLWVVTQADGQHVWAAVDMPVGIPEDAVLVGFYSYSRESRTMTWEPRTK